MRRRTTASAVVAALAMLMASPATQAAPTPEPYGTHDAGGFRNVLPPGTNGLANPLQLAQFEATGARPPHNDDQLAMYRDLVFAAPHVRAADLDRFYKDATFGVKPGETASTESPRDDVTIVRDSAFGVPHIYGSTRSGLMYGIGYATAEDRLFFIDVLRHLGRAQLTSFAGGAPGNRAFDAEQWGVAPYTEADLQRQIDDAPKLAAAEQRLGLHYPGVNLMARVRQVQGDADSYIAGINAYIANARLNPLLMPGEYAALGHPQGPDDFKLTDLVAIASLVGGIFGRGGGSELTNAQVLQAFQRRFGARRGGRYFLDFRSVDDPESPTTVHGRRFPYRTIPRRAAAGSVALPDPGTLSFPATQNVTGGGSSARGARVPGLLAFPRSASNALLVSAHKSASGHPIAVIGPQVAYFAPEILMEQDIHGPGIDADGAAFPGVNLYVQLGHGRDYAWSATSSGHDIIDTFAVPLCRDSVHYVFRGHCLAMEKLVRHNDWSPNVADTTPAGSETLTAYRTKLGLLSAYGRVHGRRVAFVRDRATYDHELDSAIGFDLFNDPSFMRGPKAFQRAAYAIGYTFNWFYIDSRHIAYFDAGENVVRARGTNPLYPVASKFAWSGFNPNFNIARLEPFAQHPQVVDQTYLTSWNNQQAHGYGGADEGPFTSVFRSQPLDDRIRAGIRGTRKMTLAGLVNAMEDAGTVDLRGDKVLPWALRVLGRPRAPAVAAAAAKLRAWVRAGAHRRSPAAGQPYAHSDAIRIMDAWWPLLVRSEFRPTMGGALYDRFLTLATMDNHPNNNGDHLGSSWDTGFYGYVQKDLRTLLKQHVRGRYGRVWCGGGSLARCRAALTASLRAAAAEPATKVYPGDADCPAGDQRCWDAIRFRPLGAVTQPLIPWVNRPTFQQAVEIK